MSSFAKTRLRRPRWYLIPVRVLLVTFVLTVISFAVCLLLGILGVAIAARIRGVHPDMALAYRHVAIPGAVMVGAIILVSSATIEIRHYRQSKALAEIEKASA